MKSKRARRCASALLVMITLLFFFPSGVFAADDVSDDQAAALENSDIYDETSSIPVEGMPDVTLQLDEFTTRAEFAAMINSAFGYDTLSVPELTGYVDVPADQWYAFDMGTAVALEYIAGYGNGIAAPEDFITREQVAVILCKILRLDGGGGSARFADMNDVSAWAKGAVLAVEQSGYMTEYHDQFMPKNNLTHGEAVQILSDVFGAVIDADVDAQGKTYENVTIRRSGVVLRNMVITGDLFVTEGVGDGEIWLDTVQISGRLLVAGGGENSIHMKDMIIGESIVADKPSVAGEQAVRFSVMQTNDMTVVVQGMMREVVVAEDIVIICDMNGGKTVFNMLETADEMAKPAVLISGDAAIEKITAFVPAEIIGNGAVGMVQAYTDDVVIDGAIYIDPDSIEAPEGVIIDFGTHIITGTGIVNPTERPMIKIFP